MSDRDLVALWEAHCRYEFETRDVDATMATMIDTPYVNHVPTMTGGVGHDQLKRLYKWVPRKIALARSWQIRFRCFDMQVSAGECGGTAGLFRSRQAS